MKFSLHGTYYLDGERVWFIEMRRDRAVVSDWPPSVRLVYGDDGLPRIQRDYRSPKTVDPRNLSRDRRHSRRLVDHGPDRTYKAPPPVRFAVPAGGNASFWKLHDFLMSNRTRTRRQSRGAFGMGSGTKRNRRLSKHR